MIVEVPILIMQLEKTYWAEAFGILADKFGVKWLINCERPNTV